MIDTRICRSQTEQKHYTRYTWFRDFFDIHLPTTNVGDPTEGMRARARVCMNERERERERERDRAGRYSQSITSLKPTTPIQPAITYKHTDNSPISNDVPSNDEDRQTYQSTYPSIRSPLPQKISDFFRTKALRTSSVMSRIISSSSIFATPFFPHKGEKSGSPRWLDSYLSSSSPSVRRSPIPSHPTSLE